MGGPSYNLSHIKTQDNSRSIYIYGAGMRGRELLTLIKACYDRTISVEGFIDRAATGLLEGHHIHKLSELHDKLARIVISVGDFQAAREINHMLQLAGFHDVWWYFARHYRNVYEDLFLEQCVSCQGWGEDTLLHVEIHAMDGCNLNCVGCTHFSPIFQKTVPDTQSRLDDVRALQKKISSIVDFHILGGEPFLNPDLCSYFQIKEIYPHARLRVVTNGLLLLKTPEKVLEKLCDENICVTISKYKPTSACMDKIQQILDKYNLIYMIRENKNNFNIPLSSEKGRKYCISNDCINIWNGKLAKCPTLMYITEFNKYFNTSFPEEGIISLAEAPSGKELVDFLGKDVPLCSYCGHHEIEWAVCGKHITFDKFVKTS